MICTVDKVDMKQGNRCIITLTGQNDEVDFKPGDTIHVRKNEKD